MFSLFDIQKKVMEICKRDLVKPDLNTFEHWEKFVKNNFIVGGVFRHTISKLMDPSPPIIQPVTNAKVSKSKQRQQQQQPKIENEPKTFELYSYSLPRYFFNLFETGIERISLQFSDSMINRLDKDVYIFNSDKAKVIIIYKNLNVQIEGTFKVIFTEQLKIIQIHFQSNDFQEFLPKNYVNQMFKSFFQNYSPVYFPVNQIQNNNNNNSSSNNNHFQSSGNNSFSNNTNSVLNTFLFKNDVYTEVEMGDYSFLKNEDNNNSNNNSSNSNKGFLVSLIQPKSSLSSSSSSSLSPNFDHHNNSNNNNNTITTTTTTTETSTIENVNSNFKSQQKNNNNNIKVEIKTSAPLDQEVVKDNCNIEGTVSSSPFIDNNDRHNKEMNKEGNNNSFIKRISNNSGLNSNNGLDEFDIMMASNEDGTLLSPNKKSTELDLSNTGSAIMDDSYIGNSGNGVIGGVIGNNSSVTEETGLFNYEIEPLVTANGQIINDKINQNNYNINLNNLNSNNIDNNNNSIDNIDKNKIIKNHNSLDNNSIENSIDNNNEIDNNIDKNRKNNNNVDNSNSNNNLDSIDKKNNNVDNSKINDSNNNSNSGNNSLKRKGFFDMETVQSHFSFNQTPTVNSYGIPHKIMKCYEFVDVFNDLSHLMAFSRQYTGPLKNCIPTFLDHMKKQGVSSQIFVPTPMQIPQPSHQLYLNLPNIDGTPIKLTKQPSSSDFNNSIINNSNSNSSNNNNESNNSTISTNNVSDSTTSGKKANKSSVQKSSTSITNASPTPSPLATPVSSSTPTVSSKTSTKSNVQKSSTEKESSSSSKSKSKSKSKSSKSEDPPTPKSSSSRSKSKSSSSNDNESESKSKSKSKKKSSSSSSSSSSTTSPSPSLPLPSPLLVDSTPTLNSSSTPTTNVSTLTPITTSSTITSATTNPTTSVASNLSPTTTTSTVAQTQQLSSPPTTVSIGSTPHTPVLPPTSVSTNNVIQPNTPATINNGLINHNNQQQLGSSNSNSFNQIPSSALLSNPYLFHPVNSSPQQILPSSAHQQMAPFFHLQTMPSHHQFTGLGITTNGSAGGFANHNIHNSNSFFNLPPTINSPSNLNITDQQPELDFLSFDSTI